MLYKIFYKIFIHLFPGIEYVIIYLTEDESLAFDKICFFQGHIQLVYLIKTCCFRIHPAIGSGSYITGFTKQFP